MPENDDFIELFVRKLLDDHCEMCGTSANILEFMRQIKMRCAADQCVVMIGSLNQLLFLETTLHN